MITSILSIEHRAPKKPGAQYTLAYFGKFLTHLNFNLKMNGRCKKLNELKPCRGHFKL